jgi:hypothetical protein
MGVSVAQEAVNPRNDQRGARAVDQHDALIVISGWSCGCVSMSMTRGKVVKLGGVDISAQMQCIALLSFFFRW